MSRILFVFAHELYLNHFFSMQTTLQDITSHKRVLDAVKERAGYLLQASPSNKDVKQAMTDIESRHETLSAKTRKNIEDLEWMIDNLNAHQDLTSCHAEWQKDMWEKLHSHTGKNGLNFCSYASCAVQ